jgi:S-adenosylmethionine:tRNA ribosyltransferase-isomerase
LNTSDFDYYLPEELIAQSPLEKRDNSRLLVCQRQNNRVEHRHFYDILEYINPGDCLVLNETKVLPARLMGLKSGREGASVELLLLKRLPDARWEVLVKPGKRARPGDEIEFGNGLLKAKIEDITPTGERLVRFEYDGIFEEILDQLGVMPLPPYIHEELKEKDRYQTVYAKNKGSAAAPTAGLHFTPQLLDEIERKGVSVARLTLHVGLGTFRPVKDEDISHHKMHTESYFIPDAAAQAVNTARRNGGRIIAVGTTSVRTLETVADDQGFIKEAQGNTDIFIYPGYRFKAVDALITNFHLPKSTLIMLVSALMGCERTLELYRLAVQERYRFFSFGDAMLIL